MFTFSATNDYGSVSYNFTISPENPELENSTRFKHKTLYIIFKIDIKKFSFFRYKSLAFDIISSRGGPHHIRSPTLLQKEVALLQR